MHDPFHSGERAVQDAVGVRGVALLNGRTIGPQVPAAAQRFVAGLPYCVIGALDGTDAVWATILSGPAGFVAASEDGRTLRVRFCQPSHGPASPSALAIGQPIGALCIDLGTRRRLRVTGIVEDVTEDAVAIAVRQANGLCSKYIQRRELRPVVDGVGPSAPVTYPAGDHVPADVIAAVERADTAFVASGVPGEIANVSHRGGAPGFISQVGNTLRVPDYPGNNMFNTLGNFVRHPRAGLTVPDFAGHQQIHLTGDVEMDLGTPRSWRLYVRRWAVTPLGASLAWGAVEPSRFNPAPAPSETHTP
ncbi:MAG: pyridoxamine 5'-phosphate oxidase family protein [Vicinamibacterales bacterium]